MSESFPSDRTIRQYLLGKLNDQQDLDASLSEQICFNDELAEMVEAIEDEIIEDYLDSALSAADRKAVEQYFLRPAARREKLKFARLLRESFEKKSAGAPEMGAPVKNSAAVASTWFRFHWRTCAELAAVGLFAVSLGYMGRILIGLQSQVKMTEKTETQLASDLAQEREHSAVLAHELAKFEPPVAAVPLFKGKFRGPEDHAVIIQPFTRQIHIEIDLGDASDAQYDVRLNKAENVVWSQAGLTPSAGVLRFEIPVQGITMGDYTIVTISKPAGAENSYRFRANVITKIQAPSQN